MLQRPADDLLTTAADPAPAGPVAFYLARLHSAHSRRAMLTRLRAVLAAIGAPTTDPHAFDWAALRYQHTAAIRARLIEIGQATRTINLTLAAVRGVLTTARRLGLLSPDDCAGALDGLPVVKGSADQAATGRALSAAELATLITTTSASSDAAAARDTAIIAAMYTLGLRRSEVITLQMADVQPQDRGYRLTIQGKGAKVRTGYLTGGAAAALADWLVVRGEDAGPLFVRCDHQAGPLAPLTSQAIYKLLAKRGRRAKLAPFTPHDLRRSCISNHLDAGTDVITVASIVGHSSVDTTRRYDRRGERAKERAADNLPLTYERRR